VRIRIPPELAGAVDEDDLPERFQWLAALPEVIEGIASEWGLELGDPYLPGGQCAWVAPARDGGGDELVLKVGWRHREAELEADALRFWDGDGAVRCFKTLSLDDTTASLLERCVPGKQLGHALSEHEQDVVITGLIHRIRQRHLRRRMPLHGGALPADCHARRRPDAGTARGRLGKASGSPEGLPGT
jgi:streptomycin 6-kinase